MSYTSEGQQIAAQDRLDNANIDVAASRARFARKRPAHAQIIPTNEAPIIVTPVTDTTAESVAALAAIDAESTRRENAELVAADAEFLNEYGDLVKVERVTRKYVTLLDTAESFRFDITTRQLRHMLNCGFWTRPEDPQAPALGNVLI